MLTRNENYILRMVSDIPLLICCTNPIKDIWLFELNNIGKVIWENCNECENEETVIKRIEPYFINKFTEKEKRMVEKFITELRNMGLITDYEI